MGRKWWVLIAVGVSSLMSLDSTASRPRTLLGQRYISPPVIIKEMTPVTHLEVELSLRLAFVENRSHPAAHQEAAR